MVMFKCLSENWQNLTFAFNMRYMQDKFTSLECPTLRHIIKKELVNSSNQINDQEQPPNTNLILSEIVHLGNAKYLTSDHMVEYEYTVEEIFREVFLCVRFVDHFEDKPSDEKFYVEIIINQDGSCMTFDGNMFHHFKVSVCAEKYNLNFPLGWNIVERM